jgi:hypothetical protein
MQREKRTAKNVPQLKLVSISFVFRAVRSLDVTITYWFLNLNAKYNVLKGHLLFFTISM